MQTNETFVSERVSIMRTDEEFYAYVLEKYRMKNQKAGSKKKADAASAGNYQFEQPHPVSNRRRVAGYAAAAVALVAGLGVCLYAFSPFQTGGPDISSSADSSASVVPPANILFDNLQEPVSGAYNGQTITMGYLLKTDMKIDNTVSSGFSQGYALICSIDGGKDGFCFVDEEGKILGDTAYPFAYPFGSDGRALVQKADESWVYIDTTGREVGGGKAPELQETTAVYEVSGGGGIQDGEYRLIGIQDKDGNKLTEPIFEFIQSLSLPMNYAVLADAPHKNVLIDSRGNILATLPDDADGFLPLGGDRIACAYGDGDGNTLYRLMDTSGRVLSAIYYTNIGGFENGLAPITQNGKVGLIDEQGNIVIPPTLPLDDAGRISLDYSENKIIGSLNGRLVFLGINRVAAGEDEYRTNLPGPVTGTYDGQTITMGYRVVTDHAWIFDNLTPSAFENGYAMVYDFTREYDDGIISERGTYMDKDGHKLTEPLYKYMRPFNSEGRAVAQKIDGSWVFLDRAGNESPADEEAWNNWPYQSHSSPAPVEPDGCVNAWMYDDQVVVALYGEGQFGDYCQVFDKEGNLLNDRRFERIGDFYQGLAPVIIDGKMGIIDMKGNLIIEPSLEAVCWGNLAAYEDLVIVEYDGKLAIIEITRTASNGSAPTNASDSASTPSGSDADKLTREQAVEITKEVIQKTDTMYYAVLTAEPATLGVDETQTIPDAPQYCLLADQRFRTMADLKGYLETGYTAAFMERELSHFYAGDIQSADGPRFREYNGRLYLDSRAGGIGNMTEMLWETLRIESQEGDRLTVKVEAAIDGEPSEVWTYTLLRTDAVWRLDGEKAEAVTDA